MIDVALKATLILAIGLILMRIARGATASLRHRLAAATFGIALMLPIAVAFIPKKHIDVPMPSVAAGALARRPTAEAAVATPAAAPQQSNRVDFVKLAFTVYAGGAAFFLIALAGGVWRLYRLRETADVSVAGTRLANDMAEAEGMRRGIEVVTSPTLAVPMTFGLSRPTILLPAETSEWDEDALRRAVRHELEHIVRADWITQILSRVACALYWPHPLVWSLWRRLRLEAERACDDAVIRGGVAADSYAEQLVALARRLVGRGRVPALAMATRSNLGQRVEAILDGGLRRGRASRIASTIVVVAAASFLLALAPIDVQRNRAEESVHASEDDADPLDVALIKDSAEGNVHAMRKDLDRGASPNAAIRGDGSALMFAAQQGHIEAMELLINAGADVNLGIPGDGNPLIQAARNDELDALKLLLDRGADIDRGIPGDGNALIMAAGDGHVEIVRYLLDRGADIEKVVDGDENALIHACEHGQTAVVRLLIDRRANVNARVWADFNHDGRNEGEWRTPLKMARRHGAEDVVKILIEAGARD